MQSARLGLRTGWRVAVELGAWLRHRLGADFDTQELDDAARARGASFVRLGDGTVHYELSGPPSGPTVVLVHGFTVPSFIWDHNVEPLRQAGWRVLRFDLFGRGLSDRPRIRYDLDLFDRQLRELLEVLAIPRPVHLVGLSLGGAITSTYLVRRPEQVGKLALFAPAGIQSDTPLLGKIASLPGVGELAERLLGARIMMARAPTAIGGTTGAGDYLERYASQLRFRGSSHALLSTLRDFPMAGMRPVYEQLGRLPHPVALIWGRRDAVLPFSNAELFRRLLPRLRFFELPEAGHCANFDSPALANPRLLEFLAS